MIGVSAVRVTNRRAAAMLLAGFAIAASSCQRAGSATAAALLAVDPAMTCASPDTYAGAKSALLSSIEAPADSTPERDKMRTEIMRAVTITFSQPALESYDRDTKKVACTARITIAWPAAIVQEIKAANLGRFANLTDVAGFTGRDELDLSYGIQPQAGSATLIYSASDPYRPSISTKIDRIIDFVLTAKSLAASSGPAAPAAAPASSTDAPGPGLHPASIGTPPTGADKGPPPVATK